MRRTLRTTVASGLAFAQAVFPFSTARAGGPNGGNVVTGSALITGQGTSNVVINQSSNSAIINWNSFNLGTGDSVRFNQPSAASSTLNRINGATGPSQIFGSIEANGRVFLINPDGFIFGGTARINTGSFLATTHDIRNSDFLAGNYAFNIPGNPRASITNAGTITASSGGFAALVAPAVRNDGVISANLGVVSLAGAGKGFILDLYGDRLIKLYAGDSVPGDILSSVLSNTGTLSANGGRVEMTAASAQRVVDSVINTSGIVEARSVGLRNGMIVFSAPTKSTKTPGAPAQSVNVSGRVDASGRNSNEVGGTVLVTGETIALQGVVIDTSGQWGGGKILVGGDTSGGALKASMSYPGMAALEAFSVPAATSVTIDASSRLDASATQRGNGGKIVVWSEQNTYVIGQLHATGGVLSGDGGFIETSGRSLSISGGTFNVGAPYGKRGLWLLDPDDYVIDSAAAATFATALSFGNVVVATSANGTGGQGDITVTSPITWSADTILMLDAYRNLQINATIKATGNNAGLLLNYNNGGSGGLFMTGAGASVTFTGTSPFLAINGQPYTLLRTAADLANMPASGSSGPALYYALANDINLGSATFTPKSLFAGEFDGLGHSILNLTINASGSFSTPVGLFAKLTPWMDTFGVYHNSVIRNLNLTNASITTVDANNVGALVGINYANTGFVVSPFSSATAYGQIINVNATGTVLATGSTSSSQAAYIGGLVGTNQGSIFASSFTGNVTGTVYVGGLAGSNQGRISLSSTSANVLGSFGVGGLVGYFDNGLIDQSVATGTVSGVPVLMTQYSANSIGGFVGYAGPASSIINSYSTADVSATAPAGFVGTYSAIRIGGFAGESAGTITNSYATGTVTTNLFGLGTALVGGFSGSVDATSVITSSFATGNVTINAPLFSGGASLVNSIGTFAGGNAGTIINAWATGLPTVNIVPTPANLQPNQYGPQPTQANIGGLVGANFLYNCSSCGTGTFSASGSIPGTYAAWDFTNIWLLPSNSTSTLRTYHTSTVVNPPNAGSGNSGSNNGSGSNTTGSGAGTNGNNNGSPPAANSSDAGGISKLPTAALVFYREEITPFSYKIGSGTSISAGGEFSIAQGTATQFFLNGRLANTQSFSLGVIDYSVKYENTENSVQVGVDLGAHLVTGELKTTVTFAGYNISLAGRGGIGVGVGANISTNRSKNLYLFSIVGAIGPELGVTIIIQGDQP